MVLTQSKASAHCTLLKGSTLFLHKNYRNLEHSKYLGFFLVSLFNAYLPHPAVSSMRTGRTVSLYPGLCLWHMLDKCSINAIWMDHPHLLHQSRQDQLFKTGEKASSPFQSVGSTPPFPFIIHFLPPPFIPNPPKGHRSKGRALCNKHPCVATWLTVKSTYKNCHHSGLYPNEPWAANLRRTRKCPP